MKVAGCIKELIKEIEILEYEIKEKWEVLYRWLDNQEINTTIDEVSNLQDGTGAEALIEYLESQGEEKC